MFIQSLHIYGATANVRGSYLFSANQHPWLNYLCLCQLFPHSTSWHSHELIFYHFIIHFCLLYSVLRCYDRQSTVPLLIFSPGRTNQRQRDSSSANNAVRDCFWMNCARPNFFSPISPPTALTSCDKQATNTAQAMIVERCSSSTCKAHRRTCRNSLNEPVTRINIDIITKLS